MRRNIVKFVIGHNPYCTFGFPGLTRKQLEGGRVVDAVSLRLKLRKGVVRLSVYAIKTADGAIVPAVNAENQLPYLKAAPEFAERRRLVLAEALQCR